MAPSKPQGNKEETRYLKKKKEQMGVCRPLLVRKATANVARYYDEDLTFGVMKKFLDDVIAKGDPRKYVGIMQNPSSLRVVQKTLSTDHDYPGWLREKSSTHALTTTPAMEISRTWIIQLRDPNWNEWISLFEVKPSTLPDSGYGLFAMREYKKGAAVGLFYGEISEIKTEEDENRIGREYALSMEWPEGSGRKLLVNPVGGTSASKKNYSRAYFGLHLANDPLHGVKEKRMKTRQRQTRQTPTLVANIEVTNDLVGRALVDIAEGEEIFLDYNEDNHNSRKK
jgi:hypothetical protein